MMTDANPRPPSRLHVTHEDGTVSTWRRDPLYGTRKVIDRARFFFCYPSEAHDFDYETPEDELDLWGDGE